MDEDRRYPESMGGPEEWKVGGKKVIAKLRQAPPRPLPRLADE